MGDCNCEATATWPGATDSTATSRTHTDSKAPQAAVSKKGRADEAFITGFFVGAMVALGFFVYMIAHPSSDVQQRHTRIESTLDQRLVKITLLEEKLRVCLGNTSLDVVTTNRDDVVDMPDICRDCDLHIGAPLPFSIIGRPPAPVPSHCKSCPNYASWRTYRDIVRDNGPTMTASSSTSAKLCAFCMDKVQNLEDFKLCKNDCRDYANELAAADRPL